MIEDASLGPALFTVGGHPVIRGGCDLSNAAKIEDWLCTFDVEPLDVDLSKVRTARDHWEERYLPADCAPEAEAFRVVAPVALDFDVFKDKQQFRLVGTVKPTLELACGRCLEPFELGWWRRFGQL